MQLSEFRHSCATLTANLVQKIGQTSPARCPFSRGKDPPAQAAQTTEPQSPFHAGTARVDSPGRTPGTPPDSQTSATSSLITLDDLDNRSVRRRRTMRRLLRNPNCIFFPTPKPGLLAIDPWSRVCQKRNICCMAPISYGPVRWRGTSLPPCFRSRQIRVREHCLPQFQHRIACNPFLHSCRGCEWQCSYRDCR